MVVLTGPVVMVTGVVGRVTFERFEDTKVRSVPPPPVVSAARAKLPSNVPDNVTLLLVRPLVSVSTVLVPLIVTLLTVVVAGTRSVKSMTSLASRLTMVSPFRSAAVSRKMSLPAMEPVSVLVPAPPVSTWPAPPAVILSAPALPTIFSPAVALAVKVVADASCTVVMPVMPAPMVAVPPPVTLSVLVPIVPPLMVTLPSVAEATLKVLLPPPLFTVSPAPRVTVSLPEPRLMTSLLAAPVIVMVGEATGGVSHVHRYIQPGAQRHRLCGCALSPPAL